MVVIYNVNLNVHRMFWVAICVCAARRYAHGEEIPVIAKSVSPYHNPSETYNYFSLPFCPGDGRPATAGFADEVLGKKVERTAVALNYTVDVVDETVCKVEIDAEKMKVFADAIERRFYYELYVDKLPVWALVGAGSRDKDNVLIFTRQHFNISYNKDRVIDVVLTAEAPFKLEVGRVVKFTYSAEWHPTTRGKTERRARYKNEEFFKSSVRYLALVNTVVVVLVLVVLTWCVLMRSLGNDLVRYQKELEINAFEIDFRAERGWKMLHADVFRTPRLVHVLTVLIGIGAQVTIATVLFLVLIFLFGDFMGRSGVTVLAFLCYSLSAFFGSYFGAGLYRRWNGTHWIRQLIIIALLIPWAFSCTEVVLSGIAVAYGSQQVFKPKSLVMLLLWYFFTVLPATVFGGIMGRNFFFVGPNPTRVGLIRRTIPPTPIYLTTPFVSLVISVLSFGSIFMEIHYILVAIYQYNMSHVWSFSLIVTLLLFVVVACSTVVAVYLRLSFENYHWHWLSFIAPASIAFSVFAYCVYYFFWKTEMSGVLQTMYFFAYASILSCVVGTMCGFVGFASSAWFVRRIYTNIKTD